MRDLLADNGLSLSQAQAISNLVFQKAKDIENTLDVVNNYSKTIRHHGEDLVYQFENRIPSNTKELLVEKAKLHSLQAFLMEAIKNKDEQIKLAKDEDGMEFDEEAPVKEVIARPELESGVNEEWGWSQLTNDEYYKFIEAEAYASHIGKFIHKNGKLTQLRNELPTLKGIEFIELEVGKKTPMKLEIHHKPEELSALHEDLSNLHREYEQKVNYYKAKVKNLVTEKNADIATKNAKLNEAYRQLSLVNNQKYTKLLEDYNQRYDVAYNEFQANINKKVKEIASKRIVVPQLFKSLVDKYNSLIKEDEDK